MQFQNSEGHKGPNTFPTLFNQSLIPIKISFPQKHVL